MTRLFENLKALSSSLVEKPFKSKDTTLLLRSDFEGRFIRKLTSVAASNNINFSSFFRYEGVSRKFVFSLYLYKGYKINYKFSFDNNKVDTSTLEVEYLLKEKLTTEENFFKTLENEAIEEIINLINDLREFLPEDKIILLEEIEKRVK